MESLGGNSSVVDRTLAQTMAFGYYWYVTAVYSVSEPAAYHLSELIEDHAYNT
jgi:ubiquinol oxidase